jgi:2-methylfumaryl-CoA hydratase
MSKNQPGNFFEDFQLGQVIVHATPRTVTNGEVALYTALYGSRFAVQSSAAFARAIGYPDAPLDDLLVFHIVFGKTVPDISLNAVANLGYADCRFLKAVFPGDTLSARSAVIGLKENSSRKTGVVHVHTTGFDQSGSLVLSYVRWVMVHKRDAAAPAPAEHVPPLSKAVAGDLGTACPPLRGAAYDYALAGSVARFADYAPGEKIDHVDGMTVEEAEHQIATRLYQNTARVHFNQFSEGQGRFGRRLHIAGINGGRHVAPLFAGDTVFAWSQVLERQEIAGRDDVGALRLRLVATKNRPCADFPDRSGQDYDPAVILDLDYWAVLPR